MRLMTEAFGEDSSESKELRTHVWHHFYCACAGGTPRA